MFRRIYLYRIKVLFRNRMMLFWTLMYPIVLGTFFALAFQNIGRGTPFTQIPVAVVDNAAWQEDTPLQTALHSVSADNPAATTKLFAVQTMNQQQADESLKNNQIKGYIVDGGDGGIQIIVHGSGVSQSILRQFADSYLQTRAAYTSILRENPAALTSLSGVRSVTIADASPGGLASNSMLPYFYALIAMAALFGGFWGQHEINDTQADQSDLGARLGVAPVHKLKALTAGLCAGITLQFASLIVLIAYLTLVLGVRFNAPLPLMLAGCFMGSCMGVTYGAFLSALPIRQQGLKIALLIVLSMVLSFLAGLMASSIKYMVIHAVPAMAYINPANVLSDAFYALYAYTDHSRFLLNLGLLAAFSVVFGGFTYLFTRRQKYVSL